jgi:Zn-dependent protease
MAAGSTGFMLNLLQLVPAKPLDGGFIIQAVSRWLLIPGTLLLLALAFCFKSVLLLIIGVISGLSLVKQFRTRPQWSTTSQAGSLMASDPPTTVTSSSELTPASVQQRIVIALAYLSLAGMLAYLYWLSTSEVVSLIPHKQ